MPTALISGAGIAGLTLAHWLRRHGFTPTVVERAPAPRPGGQAIDIRGTALTVVERMGLLEAARGARTRFAGQSVLDADGNEVERSTEMTYTGGWFNNDDIEIMRDDLAHLLHEKARDGVVYRFGDSVSALTDTGSGVRVEFECGEPSTFDLVLGADGLHSTVRRLAFGEEHRFLRPMGAFAGIFSTENFLDLHDWQIWYMNLPEAAYGLYPTRDNTRLRVMMGFEDEPFDYDYRDTHAQKRVLAHRFATMDWETPRLLKAMWDADDFFFDSMAQIRMDTWSSGRTALVGDAAHCPSPQSGQGSSLALVGAYILADELGRAPDDHRTAFARYEERMRPFVELNQELAFPDESATTETENTARVERVKSAIDLDD
ncbi:FAD-dependent monooxygenase [Nocardiopsis rhodophaea]|uniref:FAD-dependent monooxygenase n=1 Tax=Nocardiopsis rhodophaea TaxID=280238 RepID=UPI0031CEACDC